MGLVVLSFLFSLSSYAAPRLAFQVYAVRDICAKDFVGTLKAVYAAGCNMGIGHETNGGVTTLEIAKDELPPGKTLTVAVRPLTSLGTSGRPIITDFKV